MIGTIIGMALTFLLGLWLSDINNKFSEFKQHRLDSFHKKAINYEDAMKNM